MYGFPISHSVCSRCLHFSYFFPPIWLLACIAMFMTLTTSLLQVSAERATKPDKKKKRRKKSETVKQRGILRERGKQRQRQSRQTGAERLRQRQSPRERVRERERERERDG